MFKIVFVLFTLVLAIDSSILNRLRRLGGDSQDSLDDFIVMDPTKDIVSGNNGIEYCVGTKPLATLPPFRKFLGLNRDLDSPIRSKFRISTCKTRWIFHGIGDETVTTHNFTLKTTYKKGDLFLSTLPDRLSPVNEQPEKFTLKDVKRSSAKNIISHYAGHEFNGFSLLCHTNGKLIYYKNIKTNRDNNDCQWEFLKPKPIPTPTDSPITSAPTTTITPTTESPTDSPTGSPTTTITPTTESPTHSPTAPITPAPTAPTHAPTRPITSAPTPSCYTVYNNPCWKYKDNSAADYAYFPSCTSCCHFIQCNANGDGFDMMCAPGTWWDPTVPNTPHSNGCVANHNKCFDSGKDGYGRDFTCT
eukprot:676681_1